MKDYLIEKMITLKARYAEVNRILAEEAADKEPSFIANYLKSYQLLKNQFHFLLNMKK